MMSLLEDSTLLSELEFNDLLEKAKPLIEKLSPRQKSVLLLRSKEGLSSSEIAERLKINKRTAENHLTSAKALLMKMLKDEKLIPVILLWLLL